MVPLRVADRTMSEVMDPTVRSVSGVADLHECGKKKKRKEFALERASCFDVLSSQDRAEAAEAHPASTRQTRRWDS